LLKAKEAAVTLTCKEEEATVAAKDSLTKDNKRVALQQFAK
jgi:hypothetical protein